MEGSHQMGNEQATSAIDETATGDETSLETDVTGPKQNNSLGADAGAEHPSRPRFRDRSRGWWLAALSNDAPVRSAAPRIAAGESEDTAHGPFKTVTTTVPSTNNRGRQRGVIAAILAVILIGLLIISQLTHGASAPTSAPTRATTGSTTLPFAPIAGAAVIARQTLGAGAKLSAPQEAVELANGHIAVADTGNKRLALLDAQGHLLRAVTSGAAPLQEPYAIAATSQSLYLLDSTRGAIERYALDGRFEAELIHNPALLTSARGMAVGNGGRLYVANPRTNSIAVLSPTGSVERQFSSPLSAAPGQFNQPSDVAVGRTKIGTTIYVLDNINARIEALDPLGGFLAQWAAPTSSTFYSVHLASMPGGRVLASDPSDALLVYPPQGGTATRLPLGGSASSLVKTRPLGIALIANDAALVTDGSGNRLLVVPLPR